MRFRYLAISMWLIALNAAPSHAEKRVALVIGNGAYHHADRLANPVNDARGIRAALTKLGFEVIFGENLDQKALRRTIGQFAGVVEGADVAMVYFAGHGATFGDTPYVVPVDAEFSKLQEVPYELVSVETLIGELRRVKGVRIAILDACRDNTAERELKRQAAVRGGEVSRGLGPMKNPDGLILAYATQYLSTAADTGAGGNSPFTAALLNNIATPGLDVKDLFFKVGREVIAATGGKQRPEISISIYDQYMLVPAPPKPSVAGAPAAATGTGATATAPPIPVPPVPVMPIPAPAGSAAPPQTAAVAPAVASADDLPAAVASLPAVVALQRNDATAFERFKKRYHDSARNARDEALLSIVRVALRKSVKHLLAISSGDVLLEITETSLAYMQSLQASNPESCVALSDESKGAKLTSNLAKELPILFMRDMAVLERIAGTNPHIAVAPMTAEEARPYFKTVFNSLRQQSVKSELLGRGKLDPPDFQPYCALVIAFYQAVLELPRAGKVSLLRYLYAAAAVNADSDIAK